MPRKPNYGLNKHRKEQDRKAKKDAKMRDKQQRRVEQSQLESGGLDHPLTEAGGDTQLPVPPKEES